MNILFAASEAAPFAKSGGLGDVIADLPPALRKKGIDVRVILPMYSSIIEGYGHKMSYITNFRVPVAWRSQYCGLFKYEEEDGAIFYFIDNEHYFKRDVIYGYGDDVERYAFFSRAILECLPYMDFTPEIIHCHDWQTALVPVYLKEYYRQYNIKTIFTIHNLKYQGRCGRDMLEDVIGFSYDFAFNNAFEYYGDINLLKAALYYSDYVTTVSPSYAKEIQYEFYGEGLDGTIREINNQGKLCGILNGIDTNRFNPAFDEYIYIKYDKQYEKKLENKVKLQKDLGLEVNKNKPVVAIISRLVEQKGLDLIKHIVHEMLSMDIQLILLGIGDRKYEDFFRWIESEYSSKARCLIKFDIAIANKIYAASDMFLMPSLFEPCGLAQMISFRYGTIPIVRATGGLKDTVIDYFYDREHGNGFRFDNYNAHDLLYTVQKAVKLYYEEPNKWEKLVDQAFNTNFTWEQSALLYIELYNKLL